MQELYRPRGGLCLSWDVFGSGRDLREVIRADPDLPEVHHNLASAHDRLGNRDGAIKAARDAIRLQPDFPAAHTEAHYNYGLWLAQTGRLEEAESSFRRALSALPAFAQAHINLGNLPAMGGRTCRKRYSEPQDKPLGNVRIPDEKVRLILHGDFAELAGVIRHGKTPRYSAQHDLDTHHTLLKACKVI